MGKVKINVVGIGLLLLCEYWSTERIQSEFCIWPLEISFTCTWLRGWKPSFWYILCRLYSPKSVRDWLHVICAYALRVDVWLLQMEYQSWAFWVFFICIELSSVWGSRAESTRAPLYILCKVFQNCSKLWLSRAGGLTRTQRHLL